MPTKPGVYWFRRQADALPWVYLLRLFKGELVEDYSCTPITDQEYNGEWCGPLEPPHDQEAG